MSQLAEALPTALSRRNVRTQDETPGGTGPLLSGFQCEEVGQKARLIREQCVARENRRTWIGEVAKLQPLVEQYSVRLQNEIGKLIAMAKFRGNATQEYAFSSTAPLKEEKVKFGELSGSVFGVSNELDLPQGPFPGNFRSVASLSIYRALHALAPQQVPWPPTRESVMCRQKVLPDGSKIEKLNFDFQGDAYSIEARYQAKDNAFDSIEDDFSDGPDRLWDRHPATKWWTAIKFSVASLR